MDQEISTLMRIALMLPPLVMGVVVHEVAHGWVALRCGDSTAKMLGRLTLNPIKHIDPIGTILVPALLAFFGGFIFGWAKPVPVNWRNLRNPNRDMALVAFAGPATNIIMALMWAVALSLFAQMTEVRDPTAMIFAGMCYFGIIINVVLFVLNLLPIPPLDGSRIVTAILPANLARSYNLLEPWGFFILLALIFTGVLGTVMRPLIAAVLQFIQSAVF